MNKFIAKFIATYLHHLPCCLSQYEKIANLVAFFPFSVTYRLIKIAFSFFLS